MKIDLTGVRVCDGGHGKSASISIHLDCCFLDELNINNVVA